MRLLYNYYLHLSGTNRATVTRCTKTTTKVFLSKTGFFNFPKNSGNFPVIYDVMPGESDSVTTSVTRLDSGEESCDELAPLKLDGRTQRGWRSFSSKCAILAIFYHSVFHAFSSSLVNASSQFSSSGLSNATHCPKF